MDGAADVLRVGAHLDGQTDLGDEVAGVQPHDAASDHPPVRLVEEQLHEPFVAGVGDGPPARRPGKDRFAVLRPALLQLVLGGTGPGDLRIGVGDRRNLPRVEGGLVPGRDLRGHMAFVRRLVRQHRRTGDVADGEDMRHIRPHLLVGGDVAAVIHLDAGRLGADPLPVGRAADGHQDHIVDGRFRAAVEADVDAIARGLRADGLGLQHQAIKAGRVLLLPDLDEVAVCAGHQSLEHLDDVDARAERRVDGRHLHPDDAAADHQHPLRHRRQLQRARGIDDARVIGKEGQLRRLRARRDDRLVETNAALADRQLMRSGELPLARDHLHLARLRHHRHAAAEATHHLVFPGAQLLHFDAGVAEGNAMPGEIARAVHQAGDVEQRLRRDAADVEADAAQRLVALDQHHALTQVGRPEGGGVSAGARSQHEDVTVEWPAFRAGRGGLRLFTRRSPCRFLGRGRLGPLIGSGRLWLLRLGRLPGGLQDQQDRSFRYLVADLHAHVRNGPGRGRRNVHRRLVRLERDDGLFLLDPVAGLHQHGDDRHVLEIADVGNADFHQSSILRASPSSPARTVLNRAAPAPSTTR